MVGLIPDAGSPPSDSSAAPADHSRPGPGKYKPGDPLFTGAVMEGTAAWYGPRYHGKGTAYGERFDMHAHTAASVVFPRDTLLKVENLRNGRSVEVRVNDRGGGRSGNLVDLAKGAAEAINMVSVGRVNVRVTVLRLGSGP